MKHGIGSWDNKYTIYNVICDRKKFSTLIFFRCAIDNAILVLICKCEK